MMLLLAAASAAAVRAAPASNARAPGAQATASAVIVRPLRITSVVQLSFGKLQYVGANGPSAGTVVISARPPVERASTYAQLLPGGGETPAIRTITGEPGRAYRVTVSPAAATPSGFTVDRFTVWSANSGDITARPGMLDASGTDTVRIGGALTVPRGAKAAVYTALPTINVAYE